MELRDLILNSKELIVFKNYLNWELLKWSLEDWQSLLKNEQLTFRCGKKVFTKQPQWERTTKIVKATFQDFLLFSKNQSNDWMYFDYKYLKEWFSNVEDLKKSINWGLFGFPELTSEESTIWIGSQGAHTPCHIDTYGCNIIAQVYGRKQWILCPPNENLKPTRVPYEESSIYSKLNFYSPTLECFKGVGNCRRVILEPGDALFVPHKWWHYVENLDTAISVNVWIPLPEDDKERLKESLIQLFMSQMVKNLDQEIQKAVLNPNSDEVIAIPLNDSLDVVNKCKRRIMNPELKITPKCDENESFKNCKFLQTIPILSPQEFILFLENQKNRFVSDEKGEEKCDFEEIIDVINAFTNPESISLVEKSFLASSVGCAAVMPTTPI